MKKQKELWELIHSMGKAEKRYFTLNAQKYKQTAKSNTLQLFEIFDKQKEYYEGELTKKLIGVRQLAFLQNQLYGQLLQTLSQFHVNKSKEIQFYQLFAEVRLLMHKGLHQQANKVLNKTFKMCSNEQNYRHQLIILLEQNVLYNSSSRIVGNEERHKQSEELLELIEIMRQRVLLGQLFEKMFELRQDYFQTKSNTILEKITDIINEVSLMEEIDMLELHLFKNKILFMYYDLTNNLEACYNINKKSLQQQLEQMETDHSKNLRGEKSNYVYVVHELAYAALRLNRFEECLTLLAQNETYIQNNFCEKSEKVIQSNLFLTTVNLKASVYTQQYCFEKVVDLYEKKAYKPITSMNKTDRNKEFNFYSTILRAYFCLDQLNESIICFEKINRVDTLKLGINISWNNMIYILAQYESGNYELVGRIIRKCNREKDYLTLEAKKRRLFTVFLSFANKYLSIPPSSVLDFKKVMHQFKKEVAVLPNDSEMFFDNTLSILYAWIDSKLQEQSLLSVLKQHKKLIAVVASK